MPFLSFNNINILFDKRSFIQKAYTTANNLATTKKVEFIDKYKFVETAPNKNVKTFIIHIAILKALQSVMLVNFFQTLVLVTLKQDKALTMILSKYINYVDVLLHMLEMELSENTGINNHVIELIETK